MERLDRIFVNDKWMNIFPKAIVIHLPRTHSGHNPLLLQLFHSNTYHNGKPFRLESIWCRHPNFVNIVQASWQTNDLHKAHKILKEKIIPRKNSTFGDIFKKKKRILASLQGIQTFPNYHTSLFLMNLEITLQQEYNAILKMEEDF